MNGCNIPRRFAVHNARRIRQAIYAWLALGVLLFAWDFAGRLDRYVTVLANQATTASNLKMR